MMALQAKTLTEGIGVPSPSAAGDTSSTSARRLCGWCQGPIPSRARADAIYCKTPCRQAAHRFKGTRALTVAAGSPLRLAYADPPYPDMAARYYSDHVDFGGEVDHRLLVDRLVSEYPDGWALSTSAAALQAVLALCPPTVRVAAWFRGERPTASYRPLVAWEPVIFHAGRALLSPVDQRRLDALVHVARSRTTDPHRVIGAKPGAFCHWLFDLLGMLPGDELVDLFPGSGGVERAWRLRVTSRRSRRIGLEATRTAPVSHPLPRLGASLESPPHDLDDALPPLASLAPHGTEPNE